MNEWLRLGYETARDRWHTKTGVVVAVSMVVVTLVIVFAELEFGAISPGEWGTILFSVFLIVCAWWRTRLPKARKGAVGFGVAFEFEDAPEARQLRADFVDTLRDLLNQSQLKHRFSFVEFPARVGKLVNTVDDALSLCRRANLHFLLYGRARQRTLPQGPAHVIDLRGVVRHAPVPKKVSQRLSDDFGAALPPRMVVGPTGDMIVCEFAARHVDAAARYVIGTASALSNDFDYAEELLLDAESRLKDAVEQAEGPTLSALLERVRGRLRDLYAEWVRRLMWEYTVRRLSAPLKVAERVIAQLQHYDPANYPARLAAATCAFVLRRDMREARAQLAACSGIEDGTWLYSDAFLHAYEGHLQEAYGSYMKAFRSPLSDQTVPMQAEEFIQVVLDEEPERYWLFFCLGLINRCAKGDTAAARRDFGEFIAKANTQRFDRQVRTARRWLDELEALAGGSAV